MMLLRVAERLSLKFKLFKFKYRAVCRRQRRRHQCVFHVSHWISNQLINHHIYKYAKTKQPLWM